MVAKGTNLGFEGRKHQRNRDLTVQALTLVFGYTEGRAQAAVQEMLERFPDHHLKEFLLHEGALSLAAAIAGVPPNSLTKEAQYADKLPLFFEKLEKVAEASQRDYEAVGKRIETEARIRERAHRLWEEEEGRPDGEASEHWRKAQAEIDAAMSLPHGGGSKRKGRVRGGPGGTH